MINCSSTSDLYHINNVFTELISSIRNFATMINLTLDTQEIYAQFYNLFHNDIETRSNDKALHMWYYLDNEINKKIIKCWAKKNNVFFALSHVKEISKKYGSFNTLEDILEDFENRFKKINYIFTEYIPKTGEYDNIEINTHLNEVYRELYYIDNLLTDSLIQYNRLLGCELTISED